MKYLKYVNKAFHAFIVIAVISFLPLSYMAKAEAVPNLTPSTNAENDSDNIVYNGQTVTYTYTLINSGTSNATDVDVYSELDPDVSVPSNFTFTNCGAGVTNTSGPTFVELSNVFAARNPSCVITYNVQVTGSVGAVINNSYYISSAAEGGPEVGPVNASPLTLTSPPTPSVCGNNSVETGEECDDGNLIDGDGCSAVCLIEEECGECDGKVSELTLKYNRLASAQVQVIQKNGATVFNSTIQPGAQFSFIGTDNGSLGTEIIIYVNGNEHARLHTSCSKPIGTGMIVGDFEIAGGRSKYGGLLCEVEPFCGDGIVNNGEECDDANEDDHDGCSKYCEWKIECGNGILESGEECDDGNKYNGDGCDKYCEIEAPEQTQCGNNVVETGEQCDDGNTNNGDGCNKYCLWEAICGNGVVEGDEECDDGNTDDHDGCSKYCEWKVECGNGVIEGDEQCDDGNKYNGDGCDKYCEIETGPECPPGEIVIKEKNIPCWAEDAVQWVIENRLFSIENKDDVRDAVKFYRFYQLLNQ
jgi:uncharacterized repeat protein (TIGR01451 family)